MDDDQTPVYTLVAILLGKPVSDEQRRASRGRIPDLERVEQEMILAAEVDDLLQKTNRAETLVKAALRLKEAGVTWHDDLLDVVGDGLEGGLSTAESMALEVMLSEPEGPEAPAAAISFLDDFVMPPPFVEERPESDIMPSPAQAIRDQEMTDAAEAPMPPPSPTPAIRRRRMTAAIDDPVSTEAASAPVPAAQEPVQAPVEATAPGIVLAPAERPSLAAAQASALSPLEWDEWQLGLDRRWHRLRSLIRAAFALALDHEAEDEVRQAGERMVRGMAESLDTAEAASEFGRPACDAGIRFARRFESEVLSS